MQQQIRPLVMSGLPGIKDAVINAATTLSSMKEGTKSDTFVISSA